MPPLPEPVSRQFESKGVWYSFISEKHYIDTVAAGYVVRDLFTADQLEAYAAPLIARVAELQAEREKFKAALIGVLRHFPTDTDLMEAGWASEDINDACNAYDFGKAAIAAKD